MEEMIDAGCDVLCVNLVDRTAPSRIIRLAKQNDIPIIFFLTGTGLGGFDAVGRPVLCRL